MSNYRAGLILSAIFLTGTATPAQQAAAKRAITFDDLIRMHRISAPEISKDGKWAAYAVATQDMVANPTSINIWTAPVAGGEAVQLTQSGHDTSPAWSPDGKMLPFLSSRGGNSQVYLLRRGGGEPRTLI